MHRPRILSGASSLIYFSTAASSHTRRHERLPESYTLNLETDSAVRCLSISPSEKQCVAATDYETLLYNLETGQCTELQTHPSPGRSIIWAPSDDSFALFGGSGLSIVKAKPNATSTSCTYNEEFRIPKKSGFGFATFVDGNTVLAVSAAGAELSVINASTRSSKDMPLPISGWPRESRGVRCVLEGERLAIWRDRDVKLYRIGPDFSPEYLDHFRSPAHIEDVWITKEGVYAVVDNSCKVHILSGQPISSVVDIDLANQRLVTKRQRFDGVESDPGAMDKMSERTRFTTVRNTDAGLYIRILVAAATSDSNFTTSVFHVDGGLGSTPEEEPGYCVKDRPDLCVVQEADSIVVRDSEQTVELSYRRNMHYNSVEVSLYGGWVLAWDHTDGSSVTAWQRVES
ncbi:hypothetical protein LTR49_022384 [Elasticomyces elasticus]|nr:hypothetical protein LTR49_022384 [Elasticomyces elasticus]